MSTCIQRQFILAVVTDVNHTKVTYPSCTQCYTKLLIDPTTQRYHCIKCSLSIPSGSVQWRYRLVLTIADNTGVSQVVVFGKTLEQFFGKTATDFHRSVTDLDKSGYPAEALLTQALNKTFHGKYFYFGMKLPSFSNTSTAPTLSCINQGAPAPSQSLLNNTDVWESSSHVLVYQMIASNDGVYATVSDHIRQAIRQLRGISSNKSVHQAGYITPHALDAVKPNSVSVEYSINHSTRNTESSLYRSGSFHLKQKSVALSFETSSEESLEYDSERGYGLNNVTFHGETNKICTFDEKADTLCSEFSESVDEESTSKLLLQNEGDSCKNKCENYDAVSFDSTSSNVEADHPSKIVIPPGYEYLARKLSFSEIFNGNFVSSSKHISSQSGENTFDSFKKDLDKSLTWDINLSLNDYDCKGVVNDYGLNKYQDLNDKVPKLHENSLNDSDNELEIFLNMPDSEGLQTFLNEQSCLSIASHVSVRSTHHDGDTQEKIDRMKPNLTGAVKQDVTYGPSNSQTMSKHVGDKIHHWRREISMDKINSIQLPDSEDLEAFLNSFSNKLDISGDSCNSMNTSDRIPASSLTGSENGVTTFKEMDRSVAQIKENSHNLCDDFEHLEKQEIQNNDMKHDHNILAENTPEVHSKPSKRSAKKRENSDSGVNLSTISCDLFTSPDCLSNREIEGSHLDNALRTVQGINPFPNHKMKSIADNEVDDIGNGKPVISTSGLENIERKREQIASQDFLLFSPCFQKLSKPGLNGVNKYDEAVEADFDDSWSELLPNELSENVCEPNMSENGTRAESVKSGSKETLSAGIIVNDQSDKDQMKEACDLLCSPTVGENICESHLNKHGSEGKSANSNIKVAMASDIVNQHDKKDPRTEDNHQPTEGGLVQHENSFDSSDILFDSPELFSSIQRFRPCFVTNSPSDLEAADPGPSSDARSITDTSVVLESQSTLFDSEQSSFKSSKDDLKDDCSELHREKTSKDISTVGELGVGKKVVFSRKLRRVSSCRLMDIRMKENRNSEEKKIVKPKSCLKSTAQIVTSDIHTESQDARNKDEVIGNMAVNDCDTWDDEESFFIESSQPTNVSVNKVNMQGTQADKSPGSDTIEDNEGDVFVCTPDPCKVNMQGIQADKSLASNTVAKNISNSLVCTPDLWDSSFDDSFTNCDELNEALALYTPASNRTVCIGRHEAESEHTELFMITDRSHGHDAKSKLALKTAASLQPKDSTSTLFLTNVRNKVKAKSLACKDATSATSSRTLGMDSHGAKREQSELCISICQGPDSVYAFKKTCARTESVILTPDLFSQSFMYESIVLCENSSKQSKNKENFNLNESGMVQGSACDKAKHVKNAPRPVFKCLVNNAVNCDNSVIDVSTIDVQDTLGDENYNGSPDLFCDSMFNDCDMPSGLCKQLFF